jgi:hypothetical protein
VNLEFQPAQIEFRDPFFILIYSRGLKQQTVPYIDIFDKSGLPIKRINIQNILTTYQMSLHQITHVKIPILEWSARSNYAQLLSLGNQDPEIIRNSNNDRVSDSDDEIAESAINYDALRKIIIVGECLLCEDGD